MVVYRHGLGMAFIPAFRFVWGLAFSSPEIDTWIVGSSTKRRRSHNARASGRIKPDKAYFRKQPDYDVARFQKAIRALSASSLTGAHLDDLTTL
jgi:hypothetical protein